MTNVRRRIPLYRFGYIEYEPKKGAVSGSFEFQALASSGQPAGANERPSLHHRGHPPPAAHASGARAGHEQAKSTR